jgi:hypothetical protein
MRHEWKHRILGVIGAAVAICSLPLVAQQRGPRKHHPRQ